MGDHHLAELEDQLRRRGRCRDRHGCASAAPRHRPRRRRAGRRRGGGRRARCVGGCAASSPRMLRQRGLPADGRAEPAGGAVAELEQRLEPEHPAGPPGETRDAATAHEVVEPVDDGDEPNTPDDLVERPPRPPPRSAPAAAAWAAARTTSACAPAAVSVSITSGGIGDSAAANRAAFQVRADRAPTPSVRPPRRTRCASIAPEEFARARRRRASPRRRGAARAARRPRSPTPRPVRRDRRRAVGDDADRHSRSPGIVVEQQPGGDRSDVPPRAAGDCRAIRLTSRGTRTAPASRAALCPCTRRTTGTSAR